MKKEVSKFKHCGLCIGVPESYGLIIMANYEERRTKL